MSTMPQGDQENFVCPHAPVKISQTGFYDYGKLTGKPIGGWDQLGPPTLNANIPVRYDIHKPDYEAAYHRLARLVCIAWTHLFNGNVQNCLETLEKCGDMIKDVEAPKTVLNAETR